MKTHPNEIDLRGVFDELAIEAANKSNAHVQALLEQSERQHVKLHYKTITSTEIKI